MIPLKPLERAAIFLILTLLVTWALFDNYKTDYPYTAYELYGIDSIQIDKPKEFKELLKKLKDEIKNSDIKLFKNLVKFDILLKNNIKLKNSDTHEELEVKFAIDIGQYMEVFPNEKKKVFSNVSISDLQKINLNNFEFKIHPIPETANIEKLKLIRASMIIFSIEVPLMLRNLLVFMIASTPISLGIIWLYVKIFQYIKIGVSFSKK